MHRIAITGVSGYLGSRLLAALDADPQVEIIVGVDLRPPKQVSAKLVFLRQDVTAPLEEAFKKHGVTSAVHLAFLLQPLHSRARSRHINVGGTANVLRACRAAGVRHVVFMSSTTVYGAHPDNPVPLTESSPLRPNRGMSYAEDKSETDLMLQAFAREDRAAKVAVLRGSPVLGADADNFVARGLFRSALYKVARHDPPLQYTHQEDLMALLLYCLRERVHGVYNVASEGTVRYSELGRLARKRVIAFPPGCLELLAELTWRARLQSDGNAAGVAFIKYPWVASTEALQRETGFRFAHTAVEAVRAFVQARLPASPDASGLC